MTTTIAPETTTAAATTTVSTIQRSNSRLGGEFLARTTSTVADTTTSTVADTTTTTEVVTTTITEVPITTAEPLPYDLNIMTVTKVSERLKPDWLKILTLHCSRTLCTSPDQGTRQRGPFHL